MSSSSPQSMTEGDADKPDSTSSALDSSSSSQSQDTSLSDALPIPTSFFEPDSDDNDRHASDSSSSYSKSESPKNTLDGGIFYTTEGFPLGSLIVSTTFTKEPLRVPKGEKVMVLKEVSEHATRVRVLKSGAVGLLPSYLLESEIDKMTRVNMEYNEAITCKEEIPARERRLREGYNISEEPVHEHDVCMRRIRPRLPRKYTAYVRESHPSYDNYPVIPEHSPDSPVDRLGKGVVFGPLAKAKIYRYPKEDVYAKDGEEEEGPGEEEEEGPGEEEKEGPGEEEKEGPREEEDSAWWWSGWEEIPVPPPKEKSKPVSQATSMSKTIAELGSSSRVSQADAASQRRNSFQAAVTVAVKSKSLKGEAVKGSEETKVQSKKTHNHIHKFFCSETWGLKERS